MKKQDNLRKITKLIREAKVDPTGESEPLDWDDTKSPKDDYKDEKFKSTRKEGLFLIEVTDLLKRFGVWLFLLILGVAISYLVFNINRDVGVIINNQSSIDNKLDDINKNIEKNKDKIEKNENMMIENFAIIKERLKAND